MRRARTRGPEERMEPVEERKTTKLLPGKSEGGGAGYTLIQDLDSLGPKLSRSQGARVPGATTLAGSKGQRPWLGSHSQVSGQGSRGAAPRRARGNTCNLSARKENILYILTLNKFCVTRWHVIRIAKFSKLDKFGGVDFHRWQKKMHFLLTTLKVVYVLSTPILEYVEDETVEQTRRRNKWENDDYICRGHILNDLSYTLFDIYQNVEYAKALWDVLEAKYMAKDASSKKFLIDTGATTHACKDRGWFKMFQPVDDGLVLHMGNESSAPIASVGSVVLEFTSGKTIS
ncbi:hypothetical protein Sango_1586300 [Sesamum angolense]|uniref:Retrovirus-related Pol polyprotein from transposon TNT 1-94-like beta-barrel domain-containing protein n=1 Tax=Sesamum angolense TaxID=2727404 RepID=A0AAE1WQN4_9LAMI|nr:hypothetical protein Sango_1586300 [Sesamum angolense]